MILKLYNFFLDGLTTNPKIEVLPKFTATEIRDLLSASSIKRKQNNIKEFVGIELSESDFIYFQLSGTSIEWRSKLPGRSFSGGFRLNGISDALFVKDHFWKGAFSLAPDKEVPDHLKHFDRLGWFQESADGTSQACGCFIRQPGIFPPPVVIYYGGWYKEVDFDFDEYLTKMFENFAFLGWQFFYVDFPKEIRNLEEILDNMQFAVEMLPKVFPDKDWSYHAKKYNDTLKRLKK
jgi:hypothetical protein